MLSLRVKLKKEQLKDKMSILMVYKSLSDLLNQRVKLALTPILEITMLKKFLFLYLKKNILKS
jgi:hypothetical protein